MPKIQNAPRADGKDILMAEMLVRGYRVDLFDDASGRWHSLHRRAGRYRFTESSPPLVRDLADEGFGRFSVTAAADGSEPDLYVQEALAVWQGWSLAAPPPGKAIANPDDADEHAMRDSNTNPSGTDFGLETTFAPAPGSLPRLRFGHVYRLRVRAADLAGNSVPFDSIASNSTTPEATAAAMYRRFEPVSQPFLVPRTSFAAGESLERLVIRTRTGPTTEIAERHVVPPKAAQLEAERHQVFDAGATLKRDQQGYDLAKREAVLLTAPWPASSLTVGYLPDPLARGAVLLGLPGLGPTTVLAATNKLAFTGEYPDLQAFRLVLRDGDAPPKWDPGPRELSVFLPPGQTARVRLSSYVDASDLERLGVWDWIVAKAPSNLATLLQRAQNGRHWMLTPFRTVTLVHAVARPLAPPTFSTSTLRADRAKAGDTFATITGAIAVDRKSTAHADLLAEWSDPLDDPSDSQNDPAKDTVLHRATVGAVAVPFTDSDETEDPGILHASGAPVTFSLHHDFHDTKHHRVEYRAVATTRFRDYFVGELAEGLAITREMIEADRERRPIASSARPDAPRVAYVVPTFEWSASIDSNVVGKSPPAPTTKPELVERRRRGGGLRVYLERPWFSSGAGELLGVVFQRKPFADLSLMALSRVTQWGRDPLWPATPTPAEPEYKHFKGFVYPPAQLLDKDWSLDGMSELVAVAAYPVAYDADRALWYSDVVLDLGDAYFPFVRLALARCQPHSVEGVELSRVVLADFMQLTPDRTLTVAPVSVTPKKVTLHATLAGPTYQPDTTHEQARVEITVQTRHPAVAGDLGWRDLEIGAYQVVPDPATTALWSGLISFSGELRAARLAILEHEHLSPQSHRVIYADLVPVPHARRVVRKLWSAF